MPLTSLSKYSRIHWNNRFLFVKWTSERNACTILLEPIEEPIAKQDPSHSYGRWGSLQSKDTWPRLLLQAPKGNDLWSNAQPLIFQPTKQTVRHLWLKWGGSSAPFPTYSSEATIRRGWFHVTTGVALIWWAGTNYRICACSLTPRTSTYLLKVWYKHFLARRTCRHCRATACCSTAAITIWVCFYNLSTLFPWLLQPFSFLPCTFWTVKPIHQGWQVSHLPLLFSKFTQLSSHLCTNTFLST